MWCVCFWMRVQYRHATFFSINLYTPTTCTLFIIERELKEIIRKIQFFCIFEVFVISLYCMFVPKSNLFISVQVGATWKYLYSTNCCGCLFQMSQHWSDSSQHCKTTETTWPEFKDPVFTISVLVISFFLSLTYHESHMLTLKLLQQMDCLWFIRFCFFFPMMLPFEINMHCLICILYHLFRVMLILLQ